MTITKYRQNIEDKLDEALKGLPTLTNEQRDRLLCMIFALQDEGRSNAWRWNKANIIRESISKVWFTVIALRRGEHEEDTFKAGIEASWRAIGKWQGDNAVETTLPPPAFDAEEPPQ